VCCTQIWPRRCAASADRSTRSSTSRTRNDFLDAYGRDDITDEWLRWFDDLDRIFCD